MTDKPFESMTLHELLISVEHHARDLSEHLDLNFMPKLQSLDETIHPKDGSEARDTTVRSKAGEILESDKFTQSMLTKMHEILVAVDASLRRQAGSARK